MLVVVLVAEPPPVVLVVVVVLVVDPPVVGAVLVVVLPPPADAAVVVVVAGGAAGATKGTVSPRMVASVVVGVADRLVQLRAAFQLATAVVAGVPDSGWGKPLRMVAGVPDGARDVSALRGDHEGAAVRLRGRVVVEGEVAQAVVDVSATEVAGTEEGRGRRIR